MTGLPVRPEILAARRSEGFRQLGFSEDLFTLVAFGGSRGAMSINQAMLRVNRTIFNGKNTNIMDNRRNRL